MTGSADNARRAAVVSRLVTAPREEMPPAAQKALLTDRNDDRRVVLVELRLHAGDDVRAIRERFLRLFREVFAKQRVPRPVPVGRHYMRCVLTREQVAQLVGNGAGARSASVLEALEVIYHIWPDLIVEAHLDRSLTTIKADAASRTYGCGGAGVVWAVLDSGIDGSHPHFATHGTLSASVVAGLHRDFTVPTTPNASRDPLTDVFGHGTHIAGIIAGQAPADPSQLRIATNEPTASGWPNWTARTLSDGATLSGVAPKANLVSLKVLDGNGRALSSSVIEALDYVRTVNNGGRDLVIHGVNLSLGCSWMPRDFAAGQSPLCKELDLLVGTGVVAVVSAGNAGAGSAGVGAAATVAGVTGDVYGQLSTITDPGNAAGAITVGSVHRYRPHTYGVTFDSSKGPTLDGRRKPELVAPGERITSAATGHAAEGVPPLTPPAGTTGCADYIEQSGTSMAAAHVSGAIAAFISTRTEFVGQPQMVRKVFTESAIDLGRHEFFQGAGLIDLMRALSST
jgi:subtilisin family serine protease